MPYNEAYFRTGGPTVPLAIQFLQDTASASDPVDEQLVSDFLVWGDWDAKWAERARSCLNTAVLT